MKIPKNVFLSLALLVPAAPIFADEVDMDNAITSLQGIMSTLAANAAHYANLQEDIEKISQEFDASSEVRRRLQCSITYAFDNLNESSTQRERELLDLIHLKDQEIADQQARFELLKEQAAAQVEELSNMVNALTQEITNLSNAQNEADVQPQLEQSPDVVQLFALIAQLQVVVITLTQERTFFLSKLEELATKAYGHFEVEAIENTLFGEHVCGTLYCPDFDNEEIPVDLGGVETVEVPSEAPVVQGEAPAVQEVAPVAQDETPVQVDQSADEEVEPVQVEQEVTQPAEVAAEEVSAPVEEVSAPAQDVSAPAEDLSVNSEDVTANLEDAAADEQAVPAEA